MFVFAADSWPIATAGLPNRFARLLQAAGIRTVGELRAHAGDRVPKLGPAGTDAARDFLARIDTGKCASDLPALLGESLAPVERDIVEQRFGLADPLFRPQMKWRTLHAIGQERNLTRERTRQLLRRALSKLRTHLAQAIARPILAAACERIAAAGNVVSSAELATWRGEPWLGAYQPWGGLLLLAQITGRITCRHDYFSVLPASELAGVEERLLKSLAAQSRPVRPAALGANVPVRLAGVVLDRHPAVDATRDGRFFLFPAGAVPLLRLVGDAEGYNGVVAPHSRRTARALARVLAATRRGRGTG